MKQFNSNVHLVPSPTVDLGLVKESRNQLFTLGWIGSYGGDHKTALIEIVFPALKQISFEIKLKILGITKKADEEFVRSYFHDYKNIRIEIPQIDWLDEALIQEHILQMDVGIATLTNTEIQLSKSGIKAKQYMNNGVPVLSTDLPENNVFVINGVNGFYCNSTSDFENKINELKYMTDHDYKTMMTNARASIISFDHVYYLKKFTDIYHESKS